MTHWILLLLNNDHGKIPDLEYLLRSCFLPVHFHRTPEVENRSWWFTVQFSVSHTSPLGQSFLCAHSSDDRQGGQHCELQWHSSP